MKYLMIMLMCMCLFCYSKSKHYSERTPEVNYEKQTSMKLPKGAVIVEQVENNWYIYKWRGMYFKIGMYFRHGYLTQLNGYKEHKEK